MRLPNLQPVLKGRLVTLRPLEEKDWAGLFKAASNPKTWAGHTATCQNRYQEDVFRGFFEAALSSDSALTIIDNESGDIIGSSRYHGYDAKTREIEIGWTFIDCAFWGGIYNAEIKSLMLDHIFKHVDCVVFWVAEDNIRSQRAMEKIGGKRREGEFSKSSGDEIIPYCIFEIKRGEAL